MNDTQVVDTHVIRDIVLAAQEAVSDVLTPLLETNESASFDNASSDIQAQVENIGMIAEMSGLNGLNATCLQFAAQIADLPLSSSQDALFVQEHMSAWLLDTLTYLENWQSRENIELLTRHLTANSYDACRLLLYDIESEALSLPADKEVLDIDIDDIDAMFAQDDIDLDSLDGVMTLLCQEIRELQPKISAITQNLVRSDGADALRESTAYMEIIARIHNTSDGLGLSGLVQICDFVLKNISMLLTLQPEARIKSQDVLAGWPQVVIDHLQTPADDALCLAVVDYLEDTSWPEPLKYSEIRDLIDGLTKELELTGDYEVEERSKEAIAEDVLLEIAEDTNQQLLDAIFAEAPGYAEELTMRIADIVNGIEVLENTKAAQRISHSLKGSANLIGTKGIANFAHHLEDIFEYLAKQSLPPPEPLAYTMQEAADTIEVMIEFLQGLSPAPTDALRILQDVLNWANRIDEGHLTRKTDPILPIPATNIEDDARQATNQPQTQTEFLHVPRDTIDQIFNIVGETSIAISQVQEQLKRMHERGDDMSKQDHTLQTRRFELENLISIRGMATQRLHAVTDDGHFDSLEMDQYDEFYGATHSFIEAASDTRESSRDLATNIMDLEGLFLQQQRLNHSLQNLVMTTRMVPVKTIVARLQRAVRQVCRVTNKQVELEVIGESLLIDRDVLNQLADPLMHILRNAIDHGIEPPEERVEKDKPRGGHIILRFYQEGNSIKVSCSDDGAGLDYERIRRIAMERNLVSPQEETDHATLARMILSSGFSTRDKATQISGRGVGMDVVNTAVLHLKGSIDITDNLPAGTNVNLRLPITMLTSHSILVKTEDQRFAIPTSMLEQILPPGTGQFSTLGGNLTFQLDKDVYPAKSLAQLLGLQVAANSSNNNASTVLLVRFGPEIYAVTVEYVVSNYDLVVKNPGRYVKHVPGIAGVALLGDGGVIPVLDIAELLDAQKPGRQQIVRPVDNASAEKSQLARILIVDDSLSMRKSLSLLVQDAGYQPIVARDGIEALESMQKTMPNLILTDLEMPRMTGLELATHVRSNPDNKKLPIMMITSRTMAKHRAQAKKAGVDEYLTKPFSEDALVAKIGVALHG
ncbi:MAG: response regulator [Gammaproteobacteria bacterium]